MGLKPYGKMGFRQKTLIRKREPNAFLYLRQKKSFWIASFSIIAFITGNMVGQHGWYAFWKSVLGSIDDSLIVYTGTVTPVEKVPDYERWLQYGGNASEHSYRQVPDDILVYLPVYKSGSQREANILHGMGNDVYSVGYMGSYLTGAEGDGSHPGVDIRVPSGTPVRAIANGIVSEVKEDAGFGKFIVIRHPNVPDPSNPSKTTILYSSYAHLSAMYAEKDAIVQKGEHIGDSGNTGYVSGPHLHFQIDRDKAPWHPYWPFTADEARREDMDFNEAVNYGLYRARGYLYTVNPMLYVQANYANAETTIAKENIQESSSYANAGAQNDIAETKEEKPSLLISILMRKTQRIAQLLARRDERKMARLARVEVRPEDQVAAAAFASLPESEDSAVVTSSEEIAAATNDASLISKVTSVSGNVADVRINHDGEYSGRGWEKIQLILLDGSGHPVQYPNIGSDLYLRTAYGDAEFSPSVVSSLDFQDGEYTVNMLPRGRRTIIIEIQPFGALSGPMRFGN